MVLAVFSPELCNYRVGYATTSELIVLLGHHLLISPSKCPHDAELVCMILL